MSMIHSLFPVHVTSGGREVGGVACDDVIKLLAFREVFLTIKRGLNHDFYVKGLGP